MQELYQRIYHIFGEPQGIGILVLLVDIFIVYYLIYRLLLLIQGTRAFQMLTGLILIVVFYFFSDIFRLSTLHWIISNFIFQVFLLIIVVFQNDIRRALIRLGRSPFLAGGGNHEDTFMLEELVKSAVSLAYNRIGALIVIERGTDVQDVIQDGTLLDARVSKEILQTVFLPEPENLLHDGAVIIRHGRIYKAGCFLPLSQSTRLDRALGTRHRAALGISEQSDAVVLVVSEERGAVSLCVDGKIEKDLDSALLREKLLKLFEERWRKGKSQPNLAKNIKKNLPPEEKATDVGSSPEIVRGSIQN